MNTLDKKYQNLLQDILDNGVEKSDRTGTGTLSVFGRQITHNMKQGFPALTTKKLAWKQVVSELLWFLTGQTNISFLLKHNNHIWNGDAYKRYYHHKDTFGPLTMEQFVEEIKTDKEFAKQWGDLGPIYGKQWRNWEYKESWENGFGVHLKETQIDQIQNLINELKTNPDSRRLMVSAWNVGELDKMVLPPCHYGFQVYTRELTLKERFALAGNKYPPGGLPNQAIYYMNQRGIPTRAISLSWNQRSCDFPLGIPYNIASYGILLTMLAKQVNMVPDELIGNLGDCHIYKNQIDGVNEQLNRESYELPTLKLSDKVVDDISEYTLDDIILENYKSHPKIYFPLSN